MSYFQLKNVSKKYNNFIVLKDISFSLPQNGIFGLLGTNGAGKTTLLGIILGLIKPTTGEIYLLGKDFLKCRAECLKKINFASPYLDLPKKLTVMQNLVFYSRMYGIFKNTEIIYYLANKLRIENLLGKEFGSLSSGQKTRVCLCKSLVNNPELLLLDEPTASLDPETSFFIREFLSEYQKRHEIIILLASHNMSEIEEICKEVIVLNKGNIILKGEPRSLIKKEKFRNLEELFLNIGK